MQVAKPALAVLDVRLDQIARLAAAAVALLALGELGGDELRAGALHHLFVEPRHHLVEQLPVAEQEDRKSTRLNSSHPSISYAVFCLKKKKFISTSNLLYDIDTCLATQVIPSVCYYTPRISAVASY